MSIKKKRFIFGPSVLVTAAFIGPGTVYTASKAGAVFGYVLLWAIAFSVVTTIVLQEMAARLGIVSGAGISQAIKTAIKNRVIRFSVLGLVLVAILIGNAAYQTGNLLGAAGGLKDLVSSLSGPPQIVDENSTVESWFTSTKAVWIVGVLALAIIWIGRFDVLQLLLTILVAGMGLLFVYAAFMGNPDWGELVVGFTPRIPKGSEWVVIGLIGTTVVPYNLFLHASAAAERWNGLLEETDGESKDKNKLDREAYLMQAIISSRWDTIVSILVGGLVTAAIMVTASAAFHPHVEGGTLAYDPRMGIGDQLKPVLGASARQLFAIGLFAAGLTSAITAPIAAGYAASGCFGWTSKLSDTRLKLVASFVVAAGALFATLFGQTPQQTIILAQAANGLLLPIIAVCLLWIANRSDMLGQFKNRWFSNALGGLVVVLVGLIAARQLKSVAEKIFALLN